MGTLLISLERLAIAAERIAAHLEVLTSVATSLARIADHLAPSPVVLVGSRYLADRLGCTTVWVAAMARRGEIPRHLAVPGTGSGKPWKFYREGIDAWLASR